MLSSVARAALPEQCYPSSVTRAVLPEQGLDLLGGEPDANRVLVRGVGVQHYLVPPQRGQSLTAAATSAASPATAAVQATAGLREPPRRIRSRHRQRSPSR